MTSLKVTLPQLKKTVHLGRKKPIPGKKHVRLAKFLAATIEGLPPTMDLRPKAVKSLNRVYLNDSLGDCVIAGEAHLIGVRSGNDGEEVQFTDEQIVATYREICGPGDDGCVITDVLDALKTKGFPGGHKIAGYVSVDSNNQDETRVAAWLFGGLTLGINLPRRWINNTKPNFVWDNTGGPIVGGHEVVVIGFGPQGVLISTWGLTGTITWSAVKNRDLIEECYASVGFDWLGNDKKAPNGFDLDGLLADLKAIEHGDIPNVTPPPPPAPVPPAPPTPPTPTPPPPAPPAPPIPTPPPPLDPSLFLMFLNVLLDRLEAKAPALKGLIEWFRLLVNNYLSIKSNRTKIEAVFASSSWVVAVDALLDSLIAIASPLEKMLLQVLKTIIDANFKQSAAA